MAVAGCINAYDCSGTLIRTLEQLQSSNIGVGVQYTAPNPLDDKKIDYIKYTDKCGNTCCLTGENEILIYATNGVIKNLSLTNDDTNEAVVVKWNDIFGSNRAKTVVRYKTGSAPISPTDGTLAVEETTKNQYSTNGFSVTGLSDSTTYYFSVFAVDGDGTMIDVQGMSITTSFVWKFEYDFRGKSVAQMQSDGFEIFRGNTNYIGFNSYGITTTVNSEPLPMRKYTNANLISEIRNAQKITLSMVAFPNSYGAVGYRLYRVADYYTRADITGIYSAINTKQTHIYGTQYDDDISSSGSRTMKCEIDFVAKTLTTSDTFGYSRTWNLSDTQISNIRNNSNGIYNNIGYFGGQEAGLQSIKIEIK